MLEWFRKHAITVAMVIVVTFVATLFAGGYFFSDIGGMGSQRVSDRDQAIAWVGDTHAVPGGVYLRALNRLVEGLSPALQAQFQYDPIVCSTFSDQCRQTFTNVSS